MRPRTVRAAVLASDQIVHEGLVARLAGLIGVDMVDHARVDEADVLVFGAGLVGTETLRRLKVAAHDHGLPTVLVAGEVDDEKIGPLVGCNVTSILHSSTVTPELLMRAVRGATVGTAIMSAHLTGRVIGELRRLQRILRAEQGLSAEGLDAREIAVLRLVAEGASNSEIADRLHFSERTVKSVLQAVQIRLGLQSRSHAVAYALRAGSI